MKKITESINVLQDLDNLVVKMENEISMLRNIVYRYYLMNGGLIEGGIVHVPDTYSFGIALDKNGDAFCQKIDHQKIGISNSFQEIKEEISKFKSNA